MAHNDQSTLQGQAQSHVSPLSAGMLRIWNRRRKGVAKDGGGLLKRDAVLLSVLIGLLGVPLKCQAQDSPFPPQSDTSALLTSRASAADGDGAALALQGP